jgi:hypothetical protein
VRENVLYRIWPSKKHMFVASIDFIWEVSLDIWQRLLRDAKPSHAARLILEYEAGHYGQTGLYKVIFAGLTETNDPDIAEALRRMYRNFHAFIAARITAARPAKRGGEPAIDLGAWGVLGIATIANIVLELDLLGGKDRARLFTHAARALFDEGAR